MAAASFGSWNCDVFYIESPYTTLTNCFVNVSSQAIIDYAIIYYAIIYYASST